MTGLLAALLVLGVVAPHWLPLDRAAPPVAAVIWTSALALRAVMVLYVVVYFVVFLPRTEFFSSLTHWCWETILPLLATHLGLDGSDVGGGAVVLPAVLLGVSLTSVTWGVVKATRAIRGALDRAAVGRGPRDSVIVGGPAVLLAAAGISRPRLVVSAGALAALEDDELAAGLDHERGHIARRHRFVLLFAELCRGLARFLPGSRRAIEELRFHLERDADQWALARQHAPAALAGAICKATPGSDNSGIVSLGGGNATRRVDELLEESPTRPARALEGTFRCAAVALACLTVGVAGSLPVTAAAGVPEASTHIHRHCEH